MEKLHDQHGGTSGWQHGDIGVFLDAVVDYINENKISTDDFYAWWDEVDLSNEPSAPYGPNESSFLNDMGQLGMNWDFYFGLNQWNDL
jgi:hypothetical protein